MRTRSVALAFAVAVVVGASALVAGHFTPGTVPGTFVGPSTIETPYVGPLADSGWEVVSILSAGESAEEVPYRMVGIPDGLGALSGKFAENGDYVADKAFMTVFMNHEIQTGTANGNNPGFIRAHGQSGAFVSQWTVHLNSLQVKWGQDLIQRVFTWSGGAAGAYSDTTGATAFSRFCSADLPAATALYNPATGRGFDGRLFMDGEENGTQGRAFAHVITGDQKGTSYELPYLGRFSFENTVAHPNAGDKTIVVSMDDTSPGGEVYVYVGTKQLTGNPVERAGLSGGTLYGIRVTNGGANYGNAAVTQENAGPINGAFSLVAVTNPAYIGDGAVLQTFSTANGFTKFVRPEDGAWDTLSPNVFYFVVTGGQLSQTARLYKLTFTFDGSGVPTGGTIELVVDRGALLPAPPANVAQFDNITVAGDGKVLVEEDPGGNAYLARIWIVDPTAPIATRAQTILISDATRFGTPTAPFNQDEENSGIIEVTDIVKSANWYEKGRRYFLADMQAHYAITGEIVEGGQLYIIASPRVH